MSIMTRTREEITKRIDELETRACYLDMQDRWNRQDYQRMDEYRRGIRELKRELE
jgi:hypothetical protein